MKKAWFFYSTIGLLFGYAAGWAGCWLKRHPEPVITRVMPFHAHQNVQFVGHGHSVGCVNWQKLSRGLVLYDKGQFSKGNRDIFSRFCIQIPKGTTGTIISLGVIPIHGLRMAPTGPQKILTRLGVMEFSPNPQIGQYAVYWVPEIGFTPLAQKP